MERLVLQRLKHCWAWIHQGTPTLIVFYAENQFLILVLRLNFVTQSAQVVSQLRVLYCKISYKI